VSASEDIGNPGRTKADVSKEICGVLALSSVKESSHVGLICFSDIKERYLKPTKGHSQAYEIISVLELLKPASLRTNLSKAIAFAMNIIKKRSVIILISDFIDEGYFNNLRSMARRHDLVIIQISDKRETRLPKLGIIPVIDKESRRTLWINTSFGDFREKVVNRYESRKSELANFCRKHQVNFITIDTDEDYVPKLLKLFRVRNKSLKTS
jgi:uncharacterized protein (DUF58 family)